MVYLLNVHEVSCHLFLSLLFHRKQAVQYASVSPFVVAPFSKSSFLRIAQPCFFSIRHASNMYSACHLFAAQWFGPRTCDGYLAASTDCSVCFCSESWVRARVASDPDLSGRASPWETHLRDDVSHVRFPWRHAIMGFGTQARARVAMRPAPKFEQAIDRWNAHFFLFISYSTRALFLSVSLVGLITGARKKHGTNVHVGSTWHGARVTGHRTKCSIQERVGNE